MTVRSPLSQIIEGSTRELSIDGERVRGFIWSTPTLSSPLEDLQAMRELVEGEAHKPPPSQILSPSVYWALYGAQIFEGHHLELLRGAIHHPKECLLCSGATQGAPSSTLRLKK